MSRLIGFLIGVLYTDWLFHTDNVNAFGFAATTTGERIGSLLFAGGVTVVFYIVCAKLFSSSFFHGVIAASGFFASFDIVVIHWIFELHRLTHGPEADIIEPILVVIGIILLVYGIKKEKKSIRQAS
ncbi:hypothetical protein [Halalkalibacter alkaliphilus]|uniref:DUF2243 domain-containing protein n=1 Tax=Halalkalibacter alkaliphilus TaxID=2917993 RepID=A0A9X2I3V5_9BACI|nr:hypothetical protein [Halalkalibacter alkaliphilus]MCL7747696.1 hypothetical protein [Halalkalibacter alkaliphilus]